MSTHVKEVVKNERTNEKYSYIKHPSGLDIIVWKMDNYSTTHALFGTKYGSINTQFKTNKDKDFTVVPEGIAHFLEHKLFDNGDCDAFSLYAKTGASPNAYTSFDKTCYLFSCTDNFESSLEILLSFVQKPYFSSESVAKEQGIIGQEIRMYQDTANWKVFFNMLENMYTNHPVRIDIAGTIESIAKIDADLLYKCYNTFYNLNNMVLSIAGNVDVDRVLEICDKLVIPGDKLSIDSIFGDEPETVLKKEYIQHMEVATPLFNIGFKAKPESGINAVRAEVETNIVLALLSDESSNLYKKLYEDGLINSSFASETFVGDGYFCSIFGGESRNPREVLASIISEIERAKVDGLDKERFDIIKKSYYGSQIRGYNNVENVASSMINAYMDGVTPFDIIEVIAAVTYEDVQGRLLKQLNCENTTLSIIEPISN